MELLQPAETTDRRRQSLEGRKAHQTEKTRIGKSTDFRSKESTTLEEKTLSTTHEVTEYPVKQPQLMDDGRTLATVMERQEPAAVTVSPPSSAVDDAWDFLSDSPQKVDAETSDHPVCIYLLHEIIRVSILSRFIMHLMGCGVSLTMMLCHQTCRHV